MSSIKIKHRTTISKAHHAVSKRDKQTFELICFRVYLQLCCASRVWMKDFVTVFRETLIHFFMRIIDEFESSFFSSICFRIVDFNAVRILEMILNRRSNLSNVDIRDRSCVKVPWTFFNLAFESITIAFNAFWYKFIKIEKSKANAEVFHLRKAVEFSVNCKMRRLMFGSMIHLLSMSI